MRSRVRYRLQGKKERNTHISVIRRFTILALVGIMIYTVGLFLLEKPKVLNTRDFEIIPAKGEKVLKLQNIFGSTKLDIQVIQGNKVYKVLSKNVNQREQELTLHIDTLSAGMKEGPAKVVIKLKHNVFLTKSYSINSYIDTKAPHIELISLTNPVKQGLTGVIKLRIEDADKAYLKINSKEYKLYSVDNLHYLALFPVEVSGVLDLKVLAVDKAGNVSQKDFTLKALSFSNTKSVSELQEGENLAYKSEPRKLWEGSFLKPNKNNSIVAANNGVVISIRKNQDNTQTLIIDHGLGLMSIYKFLTQVNAKEGEYVKKGYNIGKASKNFHFGILVQGKEVEVSPWFDNRWTYENIENFLN